MSVLVPGLLVLSFILSVLGTAAIKRLAPVIGFVDKPGHRKIHHVPKPLGGGVAIFFAMAIPMVLGLIIANSVTFHANPADQSLLGRTLRMVAIHQAGVQSQTRMALLILLAMACTHLLGIWDDRKALGPFVKLFAQLAIIAGLVIAADLRALQLLDRLGMGKAPSIILTVLWITGVSNAFNFLDNMDGLSAGVAAVATTAFLVTALMIGQWFVASMLALLLGALVGFLCFNFAPASIFMGDSGSLLIGLVLGVLTVRTTYLTRPLADGWYEIFAPMIVLAVPLYDLVVVSAIRLARGKSPFVGDTNHFSHRLVARGMSRRTAVLCLYLVTAATSIAAILLPQVQSSFGAMLIFAQTVLVLGVVMLLEQHKGEEARKEGSSVGDAAGGTDAPGSKGTGSVNG
jgi:UDP-GlcNAc:undecaprenyl-phosphate GlcNAc-1-phosphate transferase